MSKLIWLICLIVLIFLTLHAKHYFPLVFVILVLFVYASEIIWRQKHGKPLNKGKPIIFSQYIMFWIVLSSSLFALQVVIFVPMLFAERMKLITDSNSIILYRYFYDAYDLGFQYLYTGYTASEANIIQSAIPDYILQTSRDRGITQTEKANLLHGLSNINVNQYPPDERLLPLVAFYRLLLICITVLSLIFGRKFIYAPFFEYHKKTKKINAISLILFLVISTLVLFGLFNLVFTVPTHSTQCPLTRFSFWCIDLGSYGYRNFAFHSLFVFYWTMIFLILNGFIQSLFNELGYEGC